MFGPYHSLGRGRSYCRHNCCCCGRSPQRSAKATRDHRGQRCQSVARALLNSKVTIEDYVGLRSTCFLCLVPCGDVRAMPCERQSWCCALRSSRAAFRRSRSWIGTAALMVEAPRTLTHCRGPCTGGAASSRAPRALLPSRAPAISTARSPGPAWAVGVACAWALTCCGQSASHSVSTEVPCARAASSHAMSRAASLCCASMAPPTWRGAKGERCRGRSAGQRNVRVPGCGDAGCGGAAVRRCSGKAGRPCGGSRLRRPHRASRARSRADTMSPASPPRRASPPRPPTARAATPRPIAGRPVPGRGGPLG